MHFVTPRFILMVGRLVRRRRFADLPFAPYCWYLDFCRAKRIVQLHHDGYADPDKGVALDNAEVARSTVASIKTGAGRDSEKRAVTAPLTGA
jgi:hypothetical protein